MPRKDSRGRRGKTFEKEIESTFGIYAERNVAYLDMMPVPTVIIKTKAGVISVPTTKAPFDVYGYWNDGVFIGAELKSSKRKNSLPIVGPKKKGDGVQYHQLDALYNLAKHRGKSRIVWDNGGEIGVISSNKIVTCYIVYLESLKSELSGKSPKMGARSIPWKEFKKVITEQWEGVSYYDWLL